MPFCPNCKKNYPAAPPVLLPPCPKCGYNPSKPAQSARPVPAVVRPVVVQCPVCALPHGVEECPLLEPAAEPAVAVPVAAVAPPPPPLPSIPAPPPLARRESNAPAKRFEVKFGSHGMSAAQYAAVCDYASSGFGAMNSVLRGRPLDTGGERSWVVSKGADGFYQFLLDCIGGMLLIPPWTKRAYTLRGTSNFPLSQGKSVYDTLAEKAANYQGGAKDSAIWTDNGLGSTTAGRKPFCKDRAPEKEWILWVYVVEGVADHGGRDIREYAKFSSEDEVLFLPASRFHVVHAGKYEKPCHTKLVDYQGSAASYDYIAYFKALPLEYNAVTLSNQAFATAAQLYLQRVVPPNAV